MKSVYNRLRESAGSLLRNILHGWISTPVPPRVSDERELWPVLVRNPVPVGFVAPSPLSGLNTMASLGLHLYINASPTLVNTSKEVLCAVVPCLGLNVPIPVVPPLLVLARSSGTSRDSETSFGDTHQSHRLSFPEREGASRKTQRPFRAGRYIKPRPPPLVVQPTEVLNSGRQKYTVQGLLGAGACGRVLLAETAEGVHVAIKVTNKFQQCLDAAGCTNLLREKTIMENATRDRSLFLTRLLESWHDERCVYFVMPWYPMSLRDRIMQEQEMSTTEAKLCCAEMVYALRELHKTKTMHRDIKPENFLVRPDGGLVLCDFGFAFNLTRPNVNFNLIKAHTTLGTPGYMAPEVITCTQTNGYTRACDVYTLGLVFVEILGNLTEPYYYAQTPEEQWKLMTDESPQRLQHAIKNNSVARDLLYKMLAWDPNLRPTPDMIMAHPFFDEINWETLSKREYKHVFTPKINAPSTKHGHLSFMTFTASLCCRSPDEEYHETLASRIRKFNSKDFKFCAEDIRKTSRP